MNAPKKSSCRSKLAFETKTDAIGAAATAHFRYGPERGGRLKPYRCPKCRLWHLATDYRDV